MKKILMFAVLAFAISNAFAQDEAKQPTKHEQAVRECNEQGEATGNKAVAEAKVQSPAEVMQVKRKAKRNTVSKCMRGAGYAAPPIRDK